jgi:hypothetical protein
MSMQFTELSDTGWVPPPQRPVGRPPGTGYATIDATLHEQMREMLEQGLVNSRTAAAKKLADAAYGAGTWDSKVKRLVRSFK